MDHIDAFNVDDQDGELDPNDAWLMRAAGGDDEVEDSGPGAAAASRDDDQFSFEDSERFEEDSLCSWMSDTESLNQNWRGWNTARNSSVHLASTELALVEGPSSGGAGHRYTGGITGAVTCQHGRHSASSSSSTAVRACSQTSSGCSAPNKVGRSGSTVAWSLRSLAEMAARKAARYYSFDALEASYHRVSSERRRMAMQTEGTGCDEKTLVMDSAFADHAAIPDKFFLSIVRWCFPESEEDIRLYSCLANGNADEFGRGEYLFQSDAVHDVFQIGYHLSAVVTGSIGSMNGTSVAVATTSAAPTAPSNRQSKTAYHVSVRVDRCRIVSCSCSCAFKASWCQHVVAVCLHRINRSQDVEYRVTIWDSINELTNEKLKKLAQFLINDLPRQYLPLAQRLIDQLRNPNSEINAAVGAPDPTDGGHEDIAIWCLDQRTLHENIRRILVKFCLPSPTVHCDVQYLSSNQPPAASEWQSLLRSHRSKDPEGLWNLLSIVREMFKRRDENATSLLHIITEECLACSQILMWWYQTSLSQSGKWSLCSSSGNKPSSLMSSQNAPQFNCTSLCEEIVQLWRLAALNPRLSDLEREQLASFLQIYHRNAVERIWKNICSASHETTQSQVSPLVGSVVDRRGDRLSAENARFTGDLFPGFLQALRACRVGWEGIPVEGASDGTKPAFNPCQFLSLSCSSSSQQDPTTFSGAHYSPNIPILRRHSRVSDNAIVADVPATGGSFYRNSVYQPGSSLYALHQQGSSRSTRHRKKSSRVTRRRGHQFEFHDERSLARAARAAAHAARDLALGEEMEEDSGESGQESEEAPSGSGAVDAFPAQDSVNGDAHSSSTNHQRHSKFPSGDIDELFAFSHVQPSNWDVKFARCEALMSHGYTRQACNMAVELAEEMMDRPPDLLHSLLSAEPRSVHDFTAARATTKTRRRKTSQPGLNSVPAAVETTLAELDTRLIETSQLAVDTFARTIFLVQSLAKEPKTHRLAFSLALFALELPRGPAATKFLEVKLYYLETELVSLLRRLEIGAAELRIIRECARRFIEYSASAAVFSRPRVLPISLAHYILDALSYTHNVSASCQGRRSASGIATRSNAQRQPYDEELAVKVALEALGMKLMASEADYPMLCESTRRQRGELAITMLMRYKDCNEKLALVLDNLLDPTMHRMYKDHQSNAVYYLEQDPIYSKFLCGQRPQYPFCGRVSDRCRDPSPIAAKTEGAKRQGSCDNVESVLPGRSYEDAKAENQTNVIGNDREMEQISEALLSMARESADESSSLGSAGRRRSSDNESPSEESSSSGISRGVPLDPAHASPIDSQSASAGTSKSPSPAHHMVASLTRAECMNDVPSAAVHCTEPSGAYSRHNRRKPIPSSPNQASEAQAHYMMELAKRLLIEAGGSQSTVIFNASQNVGGQNNPQHNGPHRQLHICSFLIGLYALGLNNLVSTSWQTRTYSTNVSWIHGQAIEIGCAAIKIVERVWETHLTPTEVAALADKASQSRDAGMVEAAAKLALSVLPKAYALTAAESQKALHQCKEQSYEMLEKACKAVEQAAEKDGVYPEVLFKVSRHWYELFCDCDVPSQQNVSGSSQNGVVTSHLPVAQFANASVQVPTYQDIHPQMHQVPIQFGPVQHPQQGVFVQTPYYHMPPHHSHQSAAPAHRPSVVVTPASSAQPQMVVQFGPRGSVNTGMVVNSSVHGTAAPLQPTPMQQPMGSSRALHVSHSAPNLSPLQAVQMCRRGGQPSLLPSAHPQYAPVGPLPSATVQPISEHVAQASMTIGGPLHHLHQVPSTSVMHYGQIGPPPGHIVQSSPQANGAHHQGGPSPAMSAFHHPSPLVSTAASCSMVVGDPRMVKLVHAHRVGMKAMETMGARNLDDNRSYAKFSQNPAYADDVKWLFSIAVKLGGVFAQSFCEVAARSIASPFVLFSLAVESTKVFHWQMPTVSYHSPSLLHPIVRSQMNSGSSTGKHNHAPQVRSVLIQSGFASPTAELMQHCVEMFYMAASSKLSHPRFVPSDTEEVVQLVKTARDAFFWIPGPGKLMFDDFMRHVRKQKACKKDVAQRINACIQQPS